MTDSSLSRIPLGFTLGQELTLPVFDEDHSEDTEVEEEPLTKRIKMGSEKCSKEIPSSSTSPSATASASLDSNPNRPSVSPSNIITNKVSSHLNSPQTEMSPGSDSECNHQTENLSEVVSGSGSAVPLDLNLELCHNTSSKSQGEKRESGLSGDTVNDASCQNSLSKNVITEIDPTPPETSKEPLPKKKNKIKDKMEENDAKTKTNKSVPSGKSKSLPAAKKERGDKGKGSTNTPSPSTSTKKRKLKKKAKRAKPKNTDDPNDDDDDRGVGSKSSSSSSSSESETDGIKAVGSKSKSGSSASSKKRKNRASHMRKNIRDILSATQLEEETLAAQREEQERIKRMNLKLQLLQQHQQKQQQQQQQNHLAQLLNSTAPPPSFHHQPFDLSQGQDEIDKMFIRKGITSTSNLDPSILSPLQILPSETNASSRIETQADSVTTSASSTSTPDLIPISKFGPMARQFPRQPLPISLISKYRKSKPVTSQGTPSVVDDIVILSSDEDDRDHNDDIEHDQELDEDQEVITLDDQDLDSPVSHSQLFLNQNRMRQQNRGYDINRMSMSLKDLKDFVPDKWGRSSLDSYLSMNSFRSSGGSITSTTPDGYCKTLTKLLRGDSNSGEFEEGEDGDGSRDGVNCRSKKEDGGDSESSDDCVVISPPSFHEEIEKEGKEDETNIPDELGRVLVNMAHPDEDPDIFLAPQIARAVKPHQIGGIRFLYDNVVESLEQFETANGFGCILAHSMGLGKTIQAVSFCDIFLRYTRAKTVLIIVPINTIQNWVNEFNFWAPTEKLSSDGNGSLTPNKKGQCINNSSKGQQPSNGANGKLKTGRKSAKNSSCKSNQTHDSPSQSVSLDQLISQPESATQSSPMNLEAQEELSSSSNLDTKDESSNSNSNNSKDSASASSAGETASASTSSNPTQPLDFLPRTFQVFVLNETVKTLTAREKIIADWNSKGGVLLLGYEMYRMLALKRLKRSTKKKISGLSLREDQAYAAAEEESSLEMIYSHIVQPGPDLVICDEGHRIKNSGASISQALKAIRTKRRIVLTGYPLQNNLMEYWCMVDFVRPNYLGSKAEFSNMFERPITNGQCVDSSFADKQLMRYRSHVLHTLLEGFVQRRSHLVLQSALPFKEEWVFLLKMTPVQYSLYKEFIRYLKEERQDKNPGVDKDGAPAPTTNPIKAFAVCCKIWNHPDALYNVVKKHKDILDDLDLDDIGGGDEGNGGPKKSNNAGRKPRKNGRNSNNIAGGRQQTSNVTFAPPLISSGSSVHSDFGLNFSADYFGGFGVAASLANIPTTVNTTSNPYASTIPDGRSISLDWATPIFKNYKAELLENGVKFQLLFVILEEIEKIGDKLLVFSQSLLTLDLIELFLAQKFNWKKNQQYFRLDGGTSGLEREKLICEFNQNTGVHLFLVSTRAGSLGINLIGANRVVVFDASWNPCHDAQAVCRVYRYGQKKECQIYRFVTDCSLEKRIYDRQINKRGIADRVVDEMNPEAHLNTKDVSSFLVLDHAQMDAVQETNHNFNMTKFSDPVLRNVLNRCGDRLTKEPFEHESLLIDRKETKLSAKEKRQARRNYEMEKKQIDQPASGFPTSGGFSYSRPSYAAFYPKVEGSGSPSSNSSSSFGGLPYSSSVQSDFYNNFPSSTYDSRNPSTIPVPPSYFNNSGGSSGSGSSHNINSSLYSSGSSGRRKLSLHEQVKELQQIQAKRVEQRDLPYQALKERGIDCRFMMLKKDAYMQDPNGGPEMYLRAGEKINIFRSNQGIYVRIANGRIIAVKPTSSNSSLLQGIPLSGEVSTEKLQSLVYSLLRPAGKGPPPYYNSYVNPKHSSNLELPMHGRSHGHGHSHSHGHSQGSGSSFYSSGSSNSKTLPSLQKLPPTAGLMPSPFHHNHQITNFRSNSGGDVTILRKIGGRNGSSGVSLNSALDSLNALPPPYTTSHKKFGSVISPGSLINPGSLAGSCGGSSNNSDDVEIIEFDTHFGELLKPTRAEENLKKLQVTPRLSSSQAQIQSANQANLSAAINGSNTNSMSSGSLSPDMSITPIPPAPVVGTGITLNSSLCTSNSVPLTLDSLLGAGAPISSAKRNFSSMRSASSSNLGSLWDQNSGGGIENSVSSTSGSGSADGNLESLFWGLTDSQSGSGKGGKVKHGDDSYPNIPMTVPQQSVSSAVMPGDSSGPFPGRFGSYDPSIALQNLLHNFSPNSNNNSKGPSSRIHRNLNPNPSASTSLNKLASENFRFLPNSDVNQFSHFFEEIGTGADGGVRGASRSGSNSEMGIIRGNSSHCNQNQRDTNGEDEGDDDVMEADEHNENQMTNDIQVPENLHLNGHLAHQTGSRGSASGNQNHDSNRNLISSGSSQYYNSSSGGTGIGAGNSSSASGNDIMNTFGGENNIIGLSSLPNSTNLKQNNSNNSANHFENLFGFSNV